MHLKFQEKCDIRGTTQVDDSVHEPCKLLRLESDIGSRPTAFLHHPLTVLSWTVLVAGTLLFQLLTQF